jgi:two-component system NarL family sensor kinase
VPRPVQQFIAYFAAEPVRVSAIRRLPLIGLIAVLVWISEVDHWLPGMWAVILGVYALAAVRWVLAVMRGPVPRHRRLAAVVRPAADLGGI